MDGHSAVLLTVPFPFIFLFRMDLVPRCECSSLFHVPNQREGLGLLEYQAMPSLRDVSHDGWLSTFTI